MDEEELTYQRGKCMSIHNIFMPLLILVLVAFVLYAFDYGMKKLLKVKREKWPSYNHVNVRHRKIDWGIRGVFTILLLTAFFYNGKTDNPLAIWPFQPLAVLILFLFLSESVRAYMEWKYAENRRTYVLTLSNMVFALGLFGILIGTNCFGFL